MAEWRISILYVQVSVQLTWHKQAPRSPCKSRAFSKKPGNRHFLNSKSGIILGHAGYVAEEPSFRPTWAGIYLPRGWAAVKRLPISITCSKHQCSSRRQSRSMLGRLFQQKLERDTCACSWQGAHHELKCSQGCSIRGKCSQETRTVNASALLIESHRSYSHKTSPISSKTSFAINLLRCISPP